MHGSIASARPALEGVWLPLVTPFLEGELDRESLATLVYYYSTTPIDGLILGATTGEGMVLSPEELAEVVAVSAKMAAGRLPIYLGLSSADTAKLARQLRQTADWPIHGYLITCPYYVRPSQEGLYQHFAALADQAAKPVALYNIPYRTGINLANDTLLRLAALPNIVGIKDCSGDAQQSFDLLRSRPKGFAVMTGEDALFHTALTQGADGGILASAHVDPEAFVAVRQSLREGDADGALALWSELIDIVRLLFAEPSPAPIKHWLWCEGLIRSPELRLPMVGVSDSMAARIATVISARTPAVLQRQSA